MIKYRVEERPAWKWWVTPKLLKEKPIHRWFVFPHSFTGELVHALIEEWELGPEDRILDPFVGAGTTLLAAKEKGIPATGYDLSPLAVLASRVKTTNYSLPRLEKAWEALRLTLNPYSWNGASRPYPYLVEKALPGRLLGAFDAIARQIDTLPCSAGEQDFFRLALLHILPRYSRAVATGGWLSWIDNRTRVTSLPSTFAAQVESMLHDLQGACLPRRACWRARLADARQLPDDAGTYSAVITSPPYPNRHDYTRVFGVELLFGFLSWEKTRHLRYQSFHSHPEAHPTRPETGNYAPPRALTRALARLTRTGQDPRVPHMLEGYFLDVHLCLREMARVCQPGARSAIVVGNAQYCGEPIRVDEFVAEIGERVGLSCEKIVTARYRGNSAQQMGKYGRHLSRESVVVFSKQV